MTPILATHADGRIAPGGALFGRSNLQDKFAKYIARRMQPDKQYRIGVGHANAEAEGHELLKRIIALHPQVHSSFVMPVGSALSVHGGPGTLVVGAQEMIEDD